MKTVIAFAAMIALAGPAFAEGPIGPGQGKGIGNGNTNAQTMAGALKTVGGGNNSPLKAAVGGTGKQGGVASFVSGDGNGGWGNIGSTLTGGQVSSSNK